MTADRLFVPEVLLDGRNVRADWAVLVQDGRIRGLGPRAELTAAHPGVEREDLPRHLLVPGAVNAHSHSFQSLLRGLGDDQPFMEWRTYLYQYLPTLDEEGVYVGALFAFGEMLLRGTTTVCDFFYLHHGDNARALAVARAARELGIRLVLVRGMMDWAVAPPAFRETPALAVENGRALASRLQGEPLCSVIPAPHSPHGASSEMVQAGARLAEEWGTPWHIHVAEAPYEGEATRAQHGLNPLAWMQSLGALDERLRIVHGTWLEDDEIAALGQARGGLIHCPGSNLFLGDGIAPIRKYVAAGVPIALGCDSGSANSRLSIFGEMRLAATLQKGLAGSSGVLGAAEAFRMGTEAGARASGQLVGRLAVGCHADLVAIDLDDLSMQPPHRLLRNVVYSLEPTAISHVFVGGQCVVRNGRLVRVARESILAGVARVTDGWAA